MFVCMGFFQGNTNGFFQKLLAFLEGIISGEICFLPLETKKTVFHAENLEFHLPFRRPCLCVGKNSCRIIKNWSNFKRVNTILYSEILLNLIRKMNCLTDKFQLCF